MVNRRHEYVIRALRETQIEAMNLGLGQNLQCGMHLNRTGTGRNGEHISSSGFGQDTIRNHIVGSFGPFVLTDDRDYWTLMSGSLAIWSNSLCFWRRIGGVGSRKQRAAEQSRDH